MTISSNTATASYAGNGVTQVFPVPFYFLADKDLKVSKKVAATGVVSVLTLNSDYTVSDAGNQAGGSITTLAVPASGDQLFIERNVDAVQETAYPANSPFPAASHEKALDRLTMLVQQLLTGLGFKLGKNALSTTYDVGGNTISNAADAVNATDLTTQQQVDSKIAAAATGVAPADVALYSKLGSTGSGQGAALLGWPTGYGVNQAASGQHFSQNGAGIHRFNDRLFVGGATGNDGAFPNVSKDWLTAYQAGLTYVGGGSPSPLVSNQGAVLTGSNSADDQAWLAGTQTIHFTASGSAAIGSSAYAINNNATYATSAWAFYGEAHKTTAAAASVYGMELDTYTTQASQLATPFQQGDVVGLQLASGAELAGGVDASAAIQIASNPNKYRTGIVFGATALTGTDGVTGSAPAISFAKGHALQWYAAGNVSTSKIVSQGTTASGAVQLNLGDSVTYLQSVSDGRIHHAFNQVSNAANYLAFYSSATGAPVQINAGGSDANIDIALLPKGSGAVWLGSYTAGAPTATGYVTVKDSSGNVRKLLCA